VVFSATDVEVIADEAGSWFISVDGEERTERLEWGERSAPKTSAAIHRDRGAFAKTLGVREKTSEDLPRKATVLQRAAEVVSAG